MIEKNGGGPVKVVLLAGGLGTRLAEETDVRPKPMVEIGGHPMLWHIMRTYASFGFNDFIVALGYKGEVVKQYFTNFVAANNDLIVDLRTGKVAYQSNHDVDWKVQLFDTGKDTMTGGRLRRLRAVLADGGTFMLTYGDGVATVDIGALLEFHRAHGRIATVTAVRPPARFGTMTFDGDKVMSFEEKSRVSEGWINGGFFVLEPAVFNYLENDATILEKQPLERLAADGELMAFRHDGFWQCMDTVRDKLRLQELWESGNPPWKSW
jgi:glucose-1-phosphate cytidylyltransferase